MKALIICTNIGVFPTKKTKTGLWFGELVYYYDMLVKKDVIVEIVSPRGGEVPLDPRSIESRDELLKRYLQDDQFMDQLRNTPAVDSVDMNRIGVIHLAGGHGAIWDYPDCTALQHAIADLYENYGMITGIGYGVSGLLNVRLQDGSWFVKDRYLTGFSNIEETLAGFSSEVPFSLEDKLIERGANFTKAMIPFTEHIEMDERLITGQNPNSARKIAQKLIEEMWEK